MVLGISVTIMACYIGRLGDIFTITAKLINMFAGPLFGVFILGMFTKRANAASVLIAGLAGALVGILTVFAKPFGLEMFMVGKLWPSDSLISGYLRTGVRVRLSGRIQSERAPGMDLEKDYGPLTKAYQL